MTATPLAPPTTRWLRGASMVLLGLAAALVVLDVVSSIPAGALTASAASFITFQVAQIALLVAGAALNRDPRHAGLGRLMLGIVTAGALLDLSGALSDLPPTAYAYRFVNALYVALIVHLVVRWPDARVTGRLARLLVLTAYVVPFALTALWQLTWDPRWYEGDERNLFWITLVPARDFSAAVYQAEQIIVAAMIAGLLAVVLARVVTARGERLAALAPVGVIAVVLAATDVVAIVSALGGADDVDLSVVQNLALLALAVTVLVAVVRAPSVVDSPEQPGRRVHLDDRARERYHLGLAGAGAGLVVVVAVLVAASSGGLPDAPSTPQPGPALVAP